MDAGGELEGGHYTGVFLNPNDSFEAGKSQSVMSLEAGLVSKGRF
jgi:hypothetical protein